MRLVGQPGMRIYDLAWLQYKQWCWFIIASLIIMSHGQPLINWDHCHPNYYTTPQCIDHPTGYGCECGPGFYWNTHKCMSSAVDSRFEFKQGEPIRYTVLLGKAFPGLNAFTIAFWVNVASSEHPGTILSYKNRDVNNILRMTSGPNLKFEILGKTEVTDIKLIAHRWYHIALTWQSTDGAWVLYMNGSPTRQGQIFWRGHEHFAIPSGGEFVLGQSSRIQMFDSKFALDGDLSHLNIWNYVMNASQIISLNTSCTFMYCGNAVQWVEFRSGTRGAMKMRWPSGIFTGTCFSKVQSATSCEKYCSMSIGAQCNEEVKENIRWTRARANLTVTMLCPELPDDGENNKTNQSKIYLH